MQKQAENRNLIATFMDAVGLAMAEKRAAGHACLLDGLRRAELLRASGAEWGGALVRRWRQALRFYISRYGIAARPSQGAGAGAECRDRDGERRQHRSAA